MNITDIRIRKTYHETRLRALVSITVDHDLAVHDIKVIEGPERLFVAMPSRKDESGSFRDISHPITPEARSQLESAILAAYREHLNNAPDPSPHTGLSPAQQGTFSPPQQASALQSGYPAPVDSRPSFTL